MNPIHEFIKCNFNVDNNTAATIIITLTVFALGLFLNWIKNRLYNKFESSRIRRLFKSLLLTTASECFKQVKYINKHIDNLKIVDYPYALNLKMSSYSYLKTIKNISFNKIFDATFNIWICCDLNNRQKAFNRLFQILTGIDFVERNIPIYHQKFIDNYNDYSERYNQNINELQNIYTELFAKNRRYTENNKRLMEYLKKLDKIVDDWRSMPNSNYLSILKEAYLKPIFELNKDFKDVAITRKMTNLVTNANGSINEIMNLYSKEEKVYLYLKSSIKAYCKQLNIICNSIY